MSNTPRMIVDNTIRSEEEWIDGLNSFPYKMLYEKIIFSGGEPSLHKGFYNIVTSVKGYKNVLIVSNLSFDVEKLIHFTRKNDASLIVQPSFHYEFSNYDVFVNKIRKLKQNNMLSNFIPVSIVDIPDREEPGHYRAEFKRNGFIASLYHFEGYYRGVFNSAVKEGFGSLGRTASVVCYSVCNSVKPNGDIVFCPTDTYEKNAEKFGNICDQVYLDIAAKRICARYGTCHVSSASWCMIKTLAEDKTVWKGKNFREKNLKTRLRNFLEKKNYPWLAQLKEYYN